MKPIGVIFDMDGVIVDSAADHLRSWQALARELGRDVTAEEFLATFGRRSSDIIATLFDIHDSARIAELDARKESIYRDLIRGRVPAMSGVRELFHSLHAAGIRLAVGSSGPPENVALVCRELDLEDCLGAVVTGADVTRGKPDPQVFEQAAARLGLPNQRCVVVEDAPTGVEAARRAGMRCIALAGSHAADALQTADRVVHRLDQIDRQVIAKLLNDKIGC